MQSEMMHKVKSRDGLDTALEFMRFDPHGNDLDIESDVDIERMDSSGHDNSEYSLEFGYSNHPKRRLSACGSDIVPEHHPSHDHSHHHSHDHSHDHFRSAIQEQIPHLHETTTQRNRSTSVSSSSCSVEKAQQQDPPAPSEDKIITVGQPSLGLLSATNSRGTKNHQSGPKRPRTAYIIFLEYFRQSYNEKFPNASFNDCQKFAGKKWRSLSEEDKRPWKEQERISQKDFIHKMHGLQSSFGLLKGNPIAESFARSSSSSSLSNEAAPSISLSVFPDDSFSGQLTHRDGLQPQQYSVHHLQQQPAEPFDFSLLQTATSTIHPTNNSVASHQSKMKLIMNASQSNKLNDLIKAPKNAFSIFVHAMREECQQNDPNLTYNEIQKQLSVQWRLMSQADKRVWIDKSSEIKKQLSKHNEEIAAQGLDQIRARKGEVRRVKKGIALPKGPRSAYTLFYQCARKQLHEVRPELSFQEYPTICSKIWRDMPEDEKVLWKTDSINDKIRYDQELLALACSEVANTATSIVLEEKFNELQARQRDSPDYNSTTDSISSGGGRPDFNLGYNHSTSSYGGSYSSTMSVSVSANSGSTSGQGVEEPPVKKARGKYKKRVPSATGQAALAPSSLQYLGGGSSIHGANNGKYSLINRSNDSSGSNGSHVSYGSFGSNGSHGMSNGFFSLINGGNGSSEVRPAASGLQYESHLCPPLGSFDYTGTHIQHEDQSVETWVDNHYSKHECEKADVGVKADVLSSFSRDSVDVHSGEVPMAGLGKTNSQSKRPAQPSTSRDFTTAELIPGAKVSERCEEDEMTIVTETFPAAAASSRQHSHTHPHGQYRAYDYQDGATSTREELDEGDPPPALISFSALEEY